VRRLSAMVSAAGFESPSLRSHGYVQTEPGYTLTLVVRGADLLVAGSLRPHRRRSWSGDAGGSMSTGKRQAVLLPHRVRQPARPQALIAARFHKAPQQLDCETDCHCIAP
jgi:hypothetical protein